MPLPRDVRMAHQRILLAQLGSFGDCLYATAVARQIKSDFPGCRLTWAIGSPYASVLEGNPFVDELWVIPISGRSDVDDGWRRFEPIARTRVKKGDFDLAFFTQLAPNNFQNFDGTIRASIFRGYPRPITVPVTPVLRLAESELENVRRFAEHHRLAGARNVLLVECAPESRQSFVTPSFAVAAMNVVLERFPETLCVFSSSQRLTFPDPRMIDGSILSFRETPGLTHYCNFMVGCSSGISWACTSDCARPIPVIQLLKRSGSVFASMAHDAERFGLDATRVLEMSDCPPSHLADCVISVLQKGFPAARQKFHEDIPVKLDMYLDVFMTSVLKQGQPLKMLRSLRNVAARYGLSPFRDYFADKFKML